LQSFKKIIALGHAHPSNTLIDARLIGGSVLFGLGWGIAGVCPGPALVGVGSGAAYATAFVPAMFLGMLAFDLTMGEGLARLRQARGTSGCDVVGDSVVASASKSWLPAW
jgi:hypothetical protein